MSHCDYALSGISVTRMIAKNFISTILRQSVTYTESGMFRNFIRYQKCLWPTVQRSVRNKSQLRPITLKRCLSADASPKYVPGTLVVKSDSIVKSIFTFGSYKYSSAMSDVYEDIASNADIFGIWNHCGMPDKLTSWIYLIFLHVWMYNVGLSQYQNSEKCKKFLIKNMWIDVENRRRLLKCADFWRKKDLQHLNVMFRTFYLQMDLAYLHSDAELAAALYKWILNNHFRDQPESSHPDTSFEHTITGLEFLVEYVRYHTHYLVNLSNDQLLLQTSEHLGLSEKRKCLGWKPVSFFVHS